MYIVGNVVPFIDAINNHALSDRNDLRRYLVQNANDCALIAVIRTGISDESE
jgi:hypothetical protein